MIACPSATRSPTHRVSGCWQISGAIVRVTSRARAGDHRSQLVGVVRLARRASSTTVLWGQLRIGVGGPAAGPPPAPRGSAGPGCVPLTAIAGVPGPPGSPMVRGRAHRRPPVPGVASRASRPGGLERASAMYRRPLRLGDPPPAPGAGAVAEPVDAGVLNRAASVHRVRTAAGPAAIAGTARLSQLSAMIRARSLQSAGACRSPASRGSSWPRCYPAAGAPARTSSWTTRLRGLFFSLF